MLEGQENPTTRGWGATFRDIADGWFFSDVKGALPEIVLLPLENHDLYDRTIWEERFAIEADHRSVSFARYRGARFGVLSPKLGAPAAAMAVEAAAARGARILIGIGYCGAISPDLSCGDIVVPTGAVSADGTSLGYCAERYPAVADHSLVATLHQTSSTPLHDGLVHSLDAVFMQDAALIERCQDLRVSAVDMETSAVLTVARLCGMRAATVLIASDHPGKGEHTDPVLLSAGTRTAVELTLEAVRSIAEKLD